MCYPTERQSARAYDAVRNLLYLHDCDLAGYRLHDEDGDWIVVVLGNPPSVQLAVQCERAMRAVGGQSVSLPGDLLLLLSVRKHLLLHHRSWAESSYRSGSAT
jgi:hypothetical protein